MSGIYIHIPFCKQRCTYCDFHFSTTFEKYRSRMVDAMVQEIHERKFEIHEPVNSIYYGGGTPSLLSFEELMRLQKALSNNFTLAQDIECTLEANPDDISLQSVQNWKQAGVNRLSIGLQSFREADLLWMNRAHTADESVACIEIARRAGIKNLSIDLIYGRPESNLEEWGKQLDQAIALEVDHISAYCLTVEPGTQLASDVEKGRRSPLSDEEESKQFALLREKLMQAGFEQYEVSNFCQPGKESFHNSNYWRGIPYLGIGPSAHSFDRKSRRFNVANNQQYMKLLEAGEEFFESETLTPKDQFNELLLTGLRTKWGSSKAALMATGELSEDFKAKVQGYISQGHLEELPQVYRLTPSGLVLADRISADLFAE